MDTLEKFQEGMVDTQSTAGKNFIQFKRQLYKLYEVSNRSLLEHEAFSLKVDRRNLKQLYKANTEYVNEISTINQFSNMVNIGQLKGKVFKAKTLSPRRLKGIGSFTLSAYAYHSLPYLTLLFGHTAPILAITVGTIYGAQTFMH